ncbi:MAG: GNAT family N-acetyltransferase [Acidobacteriota bacterium]
MTIADSGDEYEVRLASPGDIPRLGEIERAAGELFRPTIYSFVAVAEPLDPKWLLKQQKRKMVWIAVDSTGSAQGFAVVLELQDSAHLNELSVHPDHGRRGLGRRLVQAVCDWASASGYSSVTLSTFRDISWNAPFYARLGFRIMTELNPELATLRSNERSAGLPVEDRVFMRLAL